MISILIEIKCLLTWENINFICCFIFIRLLLWHSVTSTFISPYHPGSRFYRFYIWRNYWKNISNNHHLEYVTAFLFLGPVLQSPENNSTSSQKDYLPNRCRKCVLHTIYLVGRLKFALRLQISSQNRRSKNKIWKYLQVHHIKITYNQQKTKKQINEMEKEWARKKEK